MRPIPERNFGPTAVVQNFYHTGVSVSSGLPFRGGPFNYLGTKIRPAFFVKLTIVGFSWIRVWTSEDEQTRRQCVILFEHDAVSCSSLESR